MRKIIIIVVILAIVLGVVFYFASSYLAKKPTVSNEQVTLSVYSLWENDALFKPIIDQYQAAHPNVKIDYKFQSSINYRSRVQAQIDANQGPDIYLIHNSWLPIFLRGNYLAEMPKSVMSDSEYGKIFYPIVASSFSKDGKNYVLPMEVDGLALYYNTEMFKEAGVVVPKDWQQFSDVAQKLTKKDPNGRITQAGAAIGMVGNVDHWSDIVGLLFKQNPGSDLERPGNDKGAEVLQFYTNFVLDSQKKIWEAAMPPSTQAFYSGKVAMYFGPSWRTFEIRQANPQLKFATATVPQLSSKNVAWASFWGFGVSRGSAHQAEAWEFLKYLTSAETEQGLFKATSAVRDFGQPYSRVDLGQQLVGDPLVGAFLAQAPNYQSWYLCSNTFDQDINDKMIKYYEDAVNATLSGSDPQSALQTTEKGVQQVLGDLTKASTLGK